MGQYILRRLLLSIPVLFLASVILFMIVNAMPGDVVDNQLAGSGLSEEQIAQYKHEIGLDKPIFTRYFTWVGNFFRGDWGESAITTRKIRDELAERAPTTIQLGLSGLTVAVLIAFPLGIISAMRPNTPIDYGARLLAILALSIPNFVVAVVLILVFSKYLGYFPGVGFVGIWEDPIASMKKTWMPVLVIGTVQAGASARMIRSTLLEVLHSDYIRTAWSKGLRERVVITRHALKNALIPVVTILGLQLSGIIGGLVIIETMFTIPGMGSLLVISVTQRDVVPLQTLTFLFALVVVAVNLLVDISYSWLDPRIRQT